ncbi:OmpA family protein [Flavobacterium geliluteum]|uniref:OmpA family protein n=1 Tax=Flavobacterium geliluteum TaxID=2816120 RepID=A0A940XB56_9FLAO|nr:OmpA family protein [Flavobacterium geliluteum]MBP4139247.1 OmpA family protein [Flavobacterium geliluteum]
MSKKALYLLGIAVTIILGTFLYLKFCCNCCMKTPIVDTEKTSIVKATDANFVPFVLNGSGIDYHTNDNFKFLKNSATIITPVSDSISIGIENLKSFLTTNAKQKITITGYATSEETNTTKFENLGLARAHDVKTFFVSKGLSENQLVIKGEIIDEWKMAADTLLGPAEYTFEPMSTDTTSDEWSMLKEKINGSPLILHFNTNQTSDNLTAEEKQKMADITKYVSHVSNATIMVVGHTDDVGNRDSNIILGEKRAEFIKNYLTQKGIKSDRITTESKGPDEPIDENATTEGKANNRRTVITIK